MGKKSSKKKKKKKIPKTISQDIVKRVFKNLIAGVLIIVYFMILNLANNKLQTERLVGDIKVFAGTFLVLGIIFLEQAYRKDEGYRAVNGIEMIVLSAHTLSSMYVITKYQYDFFAYMATSSCIVAVYYVVKAMIVYTIGKKQYLDKFNDISEIVKDEPQKKEAKKRKITKAEPVKKEGKTTKSTKANSNAKNKKANSKDKAPQVTGKRMTSVDGKKRSKKAKGKRMR